jgi:hypothetical protein
MTVRQEPNIRMLLFSSEDGGRIFLRNIGIETGLEMKIKFTDVPEELAASIIRAMSLCLDCPNDRRSQFLWKVCTFLSVYMSSQHKITAPPSSAVRTSKLTLC